MPIHYNKDFSENFCYIPGPFLATQIVLKTNDYITRNKIFSIKFGISNTILYLYILYSFNIDKPS